MRVSVGVGSEGGIGEFFAGECGKLLGSVGLVGIHVRFKGLSRIIITKLEGDVFHGSG